MSGDHGHAHGPAAARAGARFAPRLRISFALIATFFVDILAASITAAIFLGALAYFWFYSRHHLVASAPEEEFALLQKEEQDLT